MTCNTSEQPFDNYTLWAMLDTSKDIFGHIHTVRRNVSSTQNFFQDEFYHELLFIFTPKLRRIAEGSCGKIDGTPADITGYITNLTALINGVSHLIETSPTSSDVSTTAFFQYRR